MLSEQMVRARVAGVCALVFLVCGCRNGQQPLTNPFATADRVPAPATRLIQPGTAQPYYPGDALPAAGQYVAPPATYGQTQPFAPAQPFSQAQPFGQAPAFGQAQPPVIQAQPFSSVPPAGSQTFAPSQPFTQPAPVTAPVQPFAPAQPFNGAPIPQGSGARVNPAGPGFVTAQASPPVVFAGDSAGVTIPSDDQTVRPAVAQQFLPPRSQATPAAFVNPAPQAVAPPVTNHVAVTMAPVSSPSFSASGVTQASTPASPSFSALPAASSNLPWISGSAPRRAPTLSPVVHAGAFAPLPNAAPAPRVRLPGAGSGSIRQAELAP